MFEINNLTALKSLVQEGFIFLWVNNKHLPTGIEMMKKNGYKYVEHVTWVKWCKGKLECSIRGLLQRNDELCIHGMKNPYKRIRERGNVIMAPREPSQSRKPVELHELIEAVIPEGYY